MTRLLKGNAVVNNRIAFLVTLFLLTLLTAINTQSFDSPSGIVSITADQILYSIRIESKIIALESELDTLAIRLDPSNDEIAAFSLKIANDNPNIRIMEILPGEIIDSCKWELFSPKDISNVDDSTEPGQIWQIVGMARTSLGVESPICYGFEREAILFEIVLKYQHITGTDSATYPILFYWQDCRDNVLTDKSGGLLSVSSHVLDHNDSLISSDSNIFPTRAGTPKSCIKTNLKNHPRRQISFRNGSIQIQSSSVEQ